MPSSGAGVCPQPVMGCVRTWGWEREQGKIRFPLTHPPLGSREPPGSCLCGAGWGEQQRSTSRGAWGRKHRKPEFPGSSCISLLPGNVLLQPPLWLGVISQPAPHLGCFDGLALCVGGVFWCRDSLQAVGFGHGLYPVSSFGMDPSRTEPQDLLHHGLGGSRVFFPASGS